MNLSSTCGCGGNSGEDNSSIAWQDEVDTEFMMQVQAEVTQSCALPFAVPVERIPAYIIQAAKWFWQNDDWSVEERMYAIPNSAICNGSGAGKNLNKILQLPPQFQSVFGVFRIQDGMKYGALGDFSVERMMMSSYSMFGGVGSIGGGVLGNSMGYKLTDVVSAMYEVDTFDQMLNPPLTFNYNQFSNKLVILGDLGRSDILIQTFIRCKIQDLYKNYYFFRFVVCLLKKSLSTIYGTFEFKYPGGVTINYSNFNDTADSELEEIKETIKSIRGCDYFMQPNTI